MRVFGLWEACLLALSQKGKADQSDFIMIIILESKFKYEMNLSFNWSRC